MDQISSSPTSAPPPPIVVSAEQFDTCRYLIAQAMAEGFSRVALLEAPNSDEMRQFAHYIAAGLKTEDARLEVEWMPSRDALGAAIAGRDASLSSPPVYQLVASWEAAVKTIVEYNKAGRFLPYKPQTAPVDNEKRRARHVCRLFGRHTHR